MKIHMAMAVFVLFTLPSFGQATQQPPAQSTQQPAVPQVLHPTARAIPIPNWPANKPAPVILIPTKMQSQAQVVTRIPRFVPSAPARPCAVHDNCGLIGATPHNPPAPQKADNRQSHRQ